MSYNTGRGGFGPNGQRRPDMRQMGNFPQGQRYPMQGGRGRGGPPVMPWSHQNQQQGQSQINLRQQAHTFLKTQEPAPEAVSPPSKIQKPNPPPAAEPVKAEAAPAPAPAAPTPAPAPSSTPQEHMEMSNGGQVENAIEDGETVKGKTKPYWARGPGKVNKKELRRRRNIRLRKILQPKNALMVLNELVGNTPYEVTDSIDPYSGTTFQCTVQLEGVQHVGYGKSKPAAKNAAAEAALKQMVLGKMKNLPPPPTEAELVESKMEVDDGTGISWSHVACYALHKLLNSWDEGSGLNLTEKVTQSGGDYVDISKNMEKKPAKKLPELANTMNPVMLLNQMCPSAVFEEVSKEGNPPNIQFTVKCTVGSDTFYGSGSTKKIARRVCSFAACRQTLGIQYAPAFLEEQGFTEDAVKVVAAN